MVFIGITGGVGAGKSEVLSILDERDDSVVLRADDLAKSLMEPGTDVNAALRLAFQEEGVFDSEGRLLAAAMSERIFSDDKKRQKANAIIHPVVKAEILRRVEAARNEGRWRFFFLEAALLLEEHYDEICDEIWYIYAGEEIRRRRLRESRGYSEEKITAIMKSQLPESVFREKSKRTINNGGNIENTKEQIENLMKIY